jgi:hypothetical protein
MGGMNHVRVEESQLNTSYPERVYTPPLEEDPYSVRPSHGVGHVPGPRPALIGGIMAVIAIAAAGAAWNTYGGGPAVLITANSDYKTAAPVPVAQQPDTSEVYRVMEGASVTAVSALGRPPAPSPIDLHPGGGGASSAVVTPTVLTSTPGPLAAANGGYLAQLAAVRSEDAARDAWKDTATRNPALLMGARMDIQRADLGSQGVFYRLRAGYFSDRDQAGAFCERMKSVGMACMVVAQ